MPPAASRCCPCTTPSPTPHGDLQPVTDDLASLGGPAARVGIRAAASPPSTPSAPWSPTASRTPPPTGPGSWPGGPATPRPTSAWPPATASTSWTSTAPPAPTPSGARRRPWPAELGAAGPHRRGRLALLPGPHRPRQRPPRGPGACGLAGPGRLCGRPTQPPRLRPPLPVGPRPRPRTPRPAEGPRCCSSGCTPTNAIARPVPCFGHRRGGPGDRYARAALAEELARVATAPVGQRNRQLWESTRNLYNLVATGALDHREVDHGLLQAAASAAGCWPRSPARPTGPWPPAARSAWPIPAAHDNLPAPNAPMPRRRCRGVRPASGAKEGGDGHGRRRPAGRLTRSGGGARRRQAEPAPTHHPQEGVPGWAAHQP